VSRAAAAVLLVILVAGAAARTAWLRSDPAVAGGVGVVWHDEGAWAHNARNRALWGAWRTDDWNPVYVAPVFTALEYASFRAFGVGTWQARAVSVAAGLLAILAVFIGLDALAGHRAALVGSALLATNYVFVMWNRAALMESTVAAAMVVSWAALAVSDRRPAFGLVAGGAAAVAWFTKASAAAFVAALVLTAALSVWQARGTSLRAAIDVRLFEARRRRNAALWTLAGLALVFGVIGLWFVLPHWTDYRFYNWQMSVERKPAYTLHALVDRASWLPVVQRLFSKMGIEVLFGAAGLVAIAARWRTSRPADRLLLLWLVIGMAELVVHDSGNERRYVMFVPIFVIAAARALTSASTLVPASIAAAPWRTRLLAVPLVALLAYLVFGTALRPLFAADILAGRLSGIIRLSAALALAATLLVIVSWRRTMATIGQRRMPGRVAAVLIALCLVSDVWQFTAWARVRAHHNYDASVAIGQLLPAGTLVQGKLANGLSLDNRIRPIFVGNGFGNYANRFDAGQGRYILTYDLPRIGYESSDGSGLIQGILDHFPRHRTIATFEVDETAGADEAALIDKFPDTPPPHARD
jgi:hypothetical protein